MTQKSVFLFILLILSTSTLPTQADYQRYRMNLIENGGFECITVPVSAGLHLKSGASYMGGGTVLATESMAGLAEFSGMSVITAAPGEEYCANSILVNGRVLFPSGFPATLEKLRSAGFDVIEVGMSEFRRMDGGLSCLSLRMNV